MSDIIFQVLTIIGALAFFIYGMKVMSEGIQKAAGDRLRQILGAMTSNRFFGVLTGFATTALIQSSSATTVMIVSFVNAGLLNLRQSISVIMGANIGTTMTAVLVTVLGFSKFSISVYSLPVMAIGFPLLFMKSTRLRYIGEFILGFGLLFMGLDALKGSIPGLDEGIFQYIEPLTGMGIFSTLIFVLLGTLLTVIVQSSSAAMTLTLILCGKGLPFELAAAIVLGENIGTTITANIAALIGNVHAKRAARAHLIFNVFGVVWMLILFSVFLNGVDWFMSNYTSYGSPLSTGLGEVAKQGTIQWALTIFHISFNITNVLILIWFIPFIAKTVIKMVPSTGEDEEFRLDYINSPMMSTAELSILEAKKEIAKFGEITSRMAQFATDLIVEKEDKKRNKLIKKMRKYEEITDRVEFEVSEYLAKIGTQNEVGGVLSKRMRGMLSAISDLERIGDLFYQMAKNIERKSEERIWFTPAQRQRLLEMMVQVDAAFKVMVNNLNANDGSASLQKAEEAEDLINQKLVSLRNMHLEDVGKEEYPIRSGMIYTDLYTTCEKIGDHIYNVTLGVMGKVE